MRAPVVLRPLILRNQFDLARTLGALGDDKPQTPISTTRNYLRDRAALPFLAGTAIAQSISFENKPRPGSPITGWSGNFSPSDPYSEGPGKGAWITKAGLIHSRSEVAVGEVNGKMYVLGGYADGNVAQPLNEEKDPATAQWRERAPLPRSGNYIAALGLGGKLYAIGGFREQNTNAFADASV
jgi:hypothetical protein